jgi:hypothetical protein
LLDVIIDIEHDFAEILQNKGVLITRQAEDLLKKSSVQPQVGHLLDDVIKVSLEQLKKFFDALRETIVCK